MTIERVRCSPNWSNSPVNEILKYLSVLFRVWVGLARVQRECAIKHPESGDLDKKIGHLTSCPIRLFLLNFFDYKINYYLGIKTESITWITPLEASISVALTFDILTTTPLAVVILIVLPFTVATSPAFTSLAITFPGTTW